MREGLFEEKTFDEVHVLEEDQPRDGIGQCKDPEAGT
jgi:hypothetical protein